MHISVLCKKKVVAGTSLSDGSGAFRPALIDGAMSRRALLSRRDAQSTNARRFERWKGLRGGALVAHREIASFSHRSQGVIMAHRGSERRKHAIRWQTGRKDSCIAQKTYVPHIIDNPGAMVTRSVLRIIAHSIGKTQEHAHALVLVQAMCDKISAGVCEVMLENGGSLCVAKVSLLAPLA